jgi:Ca2+-binding EF-hand superfamily protein
MRTRILCVAVAAALASWCAAADPPASQPSPAPGGGQGGGKASDKADAQDFVFFAESRPVLIRVHVRIDGESLDAAWQDFVGQVFKYLDTDGDGVLSKEEAERTPPAAVLFNGGGFFGNGVQSPSMAALDTDRDGKVSKEELMAYYRKNGGAPFQVQGAVSADAQTLRLQARLVAMPGGQGAASSDALNEALFKLLDTNRDGKLSKEELAAAPQILAKLDEDDDEMVTAQEILPGAGASGGGLGFAVVARPIPAAGAQPANPLVMPIIPGESGANLVRQLRTRYGPKDQAQDGKKLTRKDLGLDAATFERLDADGNGELDAEELARFADRPADLEVIVRIGRRDPREPAAEVVAPKEKGAALADAVHTTKEGSVTIQLGNTRIDLRAADRGRQQPITVQQLRQQYVMQFKAADRDNNGYLDMTEAQQSPFFRGVFKLMDRDGDGKLFEKEMLAYLDAMQELQVKALASCASLGVADQGKGLFDLIDTDHDGRLSVRELRNAVKLIEQLDRDSDGCIGRGEIPRNYAVTVQQGTGGPVALGQYLVVNGNFAQPNRPAPQPTRGPLWFRKMDRNHDGDVSRREFLGTDEEFKRIDTDGDGLISADEAEAYDALMRKQKEPSP